VHREPFRDILARAGVRSPTDLPRGVLLGSLNVVDCLPIDKVLFENFDKRQLPFGDFRPGNWAWLVSEPQWLAEPIRYTGCRGLFEVADEICSQSNCSTPSSARLF
jgi:hypothetical protein